MTHERQILVVDDEPGLTDLYEAWLQPEFSVQTATDGDVALEVIEAGVDAVLLDRQMPGLSGDEVLLEMRARGHTCPAGLITAAKPEAEAVALPFDAYLLKPIDRGRFLDCVERLLSMGKYDDDSRKCLRLATKVEALARTRSETDPATQEAVTKLKREFTEAVRDATPSATELLARNDAFKSPVSALEDKQPVK